MNIPKIMPAAGHIKTVGAIRRIAREPNIAEIRAGSYTLLPRSGNPAPNFIEFTPGTYGNCLGLPNGGLPYLERQITAMQEAAGGTPLVLSFAPIEKGDLARLVDFSVNAGVAAIELNLGCPNVWDGGANKKPLSADPEAVRRALEEVAPFRGKIWVGVKCTSLSRYDMNKIVALFHNVGIDEMVTMNADPGYTFSDREGRNLLSMESAALSGQAIHHKAIEQAVWARGDIDRLRANIRLVGVGGINSGKTFRNFAEAGVDACQIGSHYFWRDDPKIFGEILGEYVDLAA